ncbi:MAG: nucleotidyltransferase domain-containing protein [Planctomycetes bacterium]|nr:nucleotidyltransferase domain-containing protein [Planctomycetota bacterium]MBU1518218.1 nucleotidyltransferase domain-containing protein [Planctomycetota bacterium]MBU2457116.1 nucleotidyltransferase domain-containing protein [Planctomycetota bacterium]MBU2596000.1 nucleotidyltransferase domain-containing protein [Planctomycetota bacterium]
MVKEKDSRIRIERFGLKPDAVYLISEIFHRHPEVYRVKVFGSRAMGRFNGYSDVDLALWGKLNLNIIGRIMRELDELPLPYTFDVKAYERIKHSPLKRHIDEFGKILYSV